MSYTIGVDTGGTFTDVAALGDNGKVVTAKASTTPEDLIEGILAAVSGVAAELGLELDALLRDTGVFRFSGTPAINALLVRGGARTAIVTTKGFEDTTFIARAMPGWAGLGENELRHAYRQRKPAPLVSKSLVRGITERTDRDGVEVVALDEAELRAAIMGLAEDGVEAVAICFLWSPRNAEHERRAAAIVRELLPEAYVSASHEVSSEVGEYERFITTVINAYVGPLLQQTIERLEARLHAQGFAGQLLIAQSDGGCLYADETRPAYTMQSGPAGGVLACREEGQLLGLRNIIGADVGGTSFDVGLVVDGSWVRATEPVVASFHLSFPMIEVESIGAGGGSIAWLDEGGALNVGPRSAGANPGPAAYGRGGTEPTVTDADLILGYLNPDYFLGGRMALDLARARAAIETVAAPLGLSVEEAAAGIFDVASAHMSGLVTQRVIARGHDPRDFVLFAYGGAGAAHAAFYAAELGVREVVVPALAGSFSAMGVATAPLLHQARINDFTPMPMEAARFNDHLDRLTAQATDRLDRDKVPVERRRLVASVEMRYGLQMHNVRLEIDDGPFDDAGLAGVCDAFDRRYEELYGRGSGYADAGRFLTAITVEGYGLAQVPERAREATGDADGGGAQVGVRQAWFGGAPLTTAIYRHDRLQPGMHLGAPAIIESPQTTVVVPPGHEATVDPYLNIHISVPKAAEHRSADSVLTTAGAMT